MTESNFSSFVPPLELNNDSFAVKDHHQPLGNGKSEISFGIRRRKISDKVLSQQKEIVEFQNDEIGSKEDNVSEAPSSSESFLSFRLQYLVVHVAIMLADGLQGTHLYVLYEGYGYSVASLYSLGFVSGALTSPFIGPIVDRIGRKNAAVTYCILEIVINLLEQYNVLAGLIISRVVGGITTNLLCSVFEAWLVTEHRKRGFCEEKLETIMRDSVVTSNLSAIASGYLAHVLALWYGPVGPFEGAVACTFVALLLVLTKWDENYGSSLPGVKSVSTYMSEASATIISDPKIYKVGIIQGLADGTLQTFVFLWSPALRHFSTKAALLADNSLILGLDENHEPVYGLIFGSFMACGVLGGLCEPSVRKVVASIHSKRVQKKDNTRGNEEASTGVELLAAISYMVCACFLATPLLVPNDSSYAFTFSLVAFLMYEFLVGLYMPCEGVIRTMYMPNDSICSLMTMLRVIINVLVAAGVYSTNFISFTTAFAVGSFSLTVAGFLQLSLIDHGNVVSTSDNELSVTIMSTVAKRETTCETNQICSLKSIKITEKSLVPAPKELTRRWSFSSDEGVVMSK